MTKNVRDSVRIESMDLGRKGDWAYYCCLVLQIPSSPPVSEECRDLLMSLLQRDPDARISFEDFFNHPFIDLTHFPTPDSLEKAVSVELDCVYSLSF